MRTVIFEGNTLDVIREFPDQARQRCGHEIDRMQRGLEPIDWKPFPSIGPGVVEIRFWLDKQYRVICTTRDKNRLHVLHAFVKKTQKTRKADVDLARRRLKALIQRESWSGRK
jgi:phage-related protein